MNCASSSSPPATGGRCLPVHAQMARWVMASWDYGRDDTAAAVAPPPLASSLKKVSSNQLGHRTTAFDGPLVPSIPAIRIWMGQNGGGQLNNGLLSEQNLLYPSLA
jgi:hypothetical protein